MQSSLLQKKNIRFILSKQINKNKNTDLLVEGDGVKKLTKKKLVKKYAKNGQFRV